MILILYEIKLFLDSFARLVDADFHLTTSGIPLKRRKRKKDVGVILNWEKEKKCMRMDAKIERLHRAYTYSSERTNSGQHFNTAIKQQAVSS